MKNFSVYHDYEELYLFLRCIINKPVEFLYIRCNTLKINAI